MKRDEDATNVRTEGNESPPHLSGEPGSAHLHRKLALQRLLEAALGVKVRCENYHLNDETCSVLQTSQPRGRTKGTPKVDT